MENNNTPEEPKIIIEDDFTMFPGIVNEPSTDLKIPKSFITTEVIGLIIFAASLVWTIGNISVQCETAVCSLNSIVSLAISGVGVFLGALIMLLGFWILSKNKPEKETTPELINSLIDIKEEAEKQENKEEEKPSED